MKSPTLIALLHPLNITMAGLVAFAGLMSAWWLFPLGVVLWLIMVWNVSRDPALRFNAQMRRREPLAQRFQRAFDRVERAQVSVFNTLSASPPRIRKVLAPIQTEVDQLAEQVYLLCRRMTSLENYRVVSHSRASLANELAQLEQRVEKMADPSRTEGHAQTRRGLEERLRRLDDVAVQLDRVDAQILSVVNELDIVVTEIVSLQVTDPESAQPRVADVVRRLRQQSERLRAFEQEAPQFRGTAA